jgi:hypothetical protein
MTDHELMQQALSVLCNNVYPRDGVRDNRHLTPKSHADIYQQTIDALFNRLAQPERQWVGLTNEDIACMDWESFVTKRDCANAIEAKLKEKNT